MRCRRLFLLLLVFSVSPAYPQSADANRVFPQFDNSILPDRFGGNWQVTLKNEDGETLHNLKISMEVPYESFCDRTPEGYCHYKLRHRQGGDWEASYVSQKPMYARGFAIYASRMTFEHAYDVVGRWGASSLIRFSNGEGQGHWSYDEERGQETWQRQLPVIERVSFHAFDAPADSPAVSSVAPGEIATLTGHYTAPYWGPDNNAPGNRPRFFVEILGDNLWGFHVFDVLSGTGLEPRGCLPIRGPSGSPNNGVVGLRCEVLAWPGITNDLHVFRLDNIEIPVQVMINELPAESSLVELDVTALPDYELKYLPIQPTTPARAALYPTIVAGVENHGDETAPSVLVEMQSEAPAVRQVMLCDDYEYGCSPCKTQEAADHEMSQRRYLCEGVDLQPGGSAVTVVELDAEGSTDAGVGGVPDYQCGNPEAVRLRFYGHDGEIQDEKNSANNQAEFSVSLERTRTDGLELLGRDRNTYENKGLFELGSLYPGGEFVVRLRFAAPVCDDAQLRGLSIVMDQVDPRTNRRRLQELPARLSDDRRYLVTNTLVAGDAGTDYYFVGGNDKLIVSVEEMPAGLLSLRALNEDQNRRREIALHGRYELALQIADSDMRNVPVLPLQMHVFAGQLGDVAVSATGDAGGAAFESETVSGKAQRGINGTYTFFEDVFLTSNELDDWDDTAHVFYEPGDATLVATSAPHKPVQPGADRLKIVADLKPVVPKLKFSQQGNAVDRLTIGEPFELVATLEQPRPDLESISVTVEVQATNSAQLGANVPRELTLQRVSDTTYSGQSVVAGYQDAAGGSDLVGVGDDVLVVRHDSVKVTAGLDAPDGDEELLFTVVARDNFGVTDARVTLDAVSSDRVIHGLANKEISIKEEYAGSYELAVEFPGCCIHRSRVDIYRHASEQVEIPALVHVTATSDKLTDDQRSMATLVAERDEYRSAFQGGSDSRASGWQMEAGPFSFSSGSVLAGLRLPPGVYRLQLVHPEQIARLREAVVLLQGSRRIEFNERNVEAITDTTADELLGQLDTWQRAPHLEPDGDFDEDGIPNEFDTNPRQFSNVVWKKGRGNLPIRLLNRNGNQIVVEGVGDTFASFAVYGDAANEPAIIELLGVELEVSPGSIVEAQFR